MNYTIRKSARAKRLRIIVEKSGEVVLVIPKRISERSALRFLKQQQNWIEKQLVKQSTRKKLCEGTREEYVQYKEEVRARVNKRLEYFNSYYGFRYNRVSIRNQKTRWGSCSAKGNLNFNYKMFFLPEELFDYIIVHELCHLQEHNHSERFWNLVAQKIDTPKKAAAKLQTYM